ncbi:SH3 domain-containing protein [Lachnoclostridium phytofermentans]|uniref:SH3b domain-containing protein n=1 Tax=Lachnoclostridium phytofermentans (strain ATCC 700394 / DSM 18823 / ISDg) TaxID=357809 RepID=A9KNQ3_LACP7|nr:SH3 domain-containing protein [Lachnoclostridium phytofermentans]ABX41654.1 hypothetical protein Cphy_1276 [Lachnoclostridium phytofermentans ISDg]
MEARISKNGKRILRGAMFGACFAMTVALFKTSVTYGNELKINALVSTTQDKDETYYLGKVTGGVNVRVGAGADKDQLVVANQSVKLKKGTEVTILSEVMVGNKAWYEVRFKLGKEEVVGFATSTYIEKTKKTITPTPMPTLTPEPTSTPTPVPTAVPTVEPTATPAKSTNEAGDNSTGSMILWIFGGISMLALGIVLTLSVRKKRKEDFEEAKEVSKKVDKLKNMVITKDIDEKDSADENPKKKAAGKFTKEGRPTRQPIAIQHTAEVYVKNSKLGDSNKFTDELAVTKEQVAEDFSVIKESLEKDSGEKNELRKAVQALREHDIVIHKYFGKGEVFDNSDVKLIEVRFGGDARFLNKEQLVTKKLLQITNERRR